MLKLDSTAEDFELLERIGKGSFGAVFKAKHKESGELVAIKRVILEDNDEIQKEIEILKDCSSPHIIKYYGHFQKDSDIFIAMEFCSVGSVEDILQLQKRTFTEPEIAVICKHMVLGLQYLHDVMKQIHRDIKPDNVLITAKGEAKLADFGVSGGLDKKRTTMTGTPYFIAPEIITDDGEGYDAKADIWSLGITAIEMADGNPPYYEYSPMRVLSLIPHNPPPTVKDPSKWSSDFNEFIAKCLVKSPSKRASAVELLAHPFLTKAGGGEILSPLVVNVLDKVEKAGSLESAILKSYDDEEELQQEISKVKAAQEPEKKSEPLVSGASLAVLGDDDMQKLLQLAVQSAEQKPPEQKVLPAKPATTSSLEVQKASDNHLFSKSKPASIATASSNPRAVLFSPVMHHSSPVLPVKEKNSNSVFSKTEPNSPPRGNGKHVQFALPTTSASDDLLVVHEEDDEDDKPAKTKKTVMKTTKGIFSKLLGKKDTSPDTNKFVY